MKDGAKHTIAKLREFGVKRAVLTAEGDVTEVEFFADAPPPDDGVGGTATEPAPDASGTEDYEAALAQIRTRRFQKGADS